MALKTNTYYYIKRNGCSKYLNIYGNSFTGITQPIKLWDKVADDPMQKWMFTKDPTSTSTCIRTACNTDMAINVYDATEDRRCTIYYAAEVDSSDDYKNDCLVRVSEYTSGLYYIYLPDHGLYLTADGASNGTQVTWESKLSYASNTQLWEFEEVETETPSGSSRILNLTETVNQYYSGYNSTVRSIGCALCSGLMISKFYGTSSNNTVDYFYNNYWSNYGYSWGAPSANFSAKIAFSLATIKSEIDAGRPVAIHAYVTYSSGTSSEHWVVAYGYTNNATTENDIMVADPFNPDTTSMSGRFLTLPVAYSRFAEYSFDTIRTSSSK